MAICHRCSRTRHPLVVTVADSNHLRVNWKNSFEDCDSDRVQSATIILSPKNRIDVRFEDQAKDVWADPCKKHTSIRVELKYGESSLIISSHPRSYNAEFSSSMNPKDLYSGLLQKQVIDKICKNENGTFFVPKIPDAIQRCVQSLTFDNRTNSFTFKIVPPQISFSSEATLPVKIEFTTGPKCLTTPEEEEEEIDLKKGGPPIPPSILCTIISVEVLVLLTVTVAVLRHTKKDENKELEEPLANVNHNAAVKEGAADCKCGDNRNHDGTNMTNDKYDVRNYKVVKFVLSDGSGEAKKEKVETTVDVEDRGRNTM